MLEWKEMGFKVSSDNVSKIYLDDEEKNAQNRLFEMNAISSWKKGKLPSFYCVAF